MRPSKDWGEEFTKHLADIDRSLPSEGVSDRASTIDALVVSRELLKGSWLTCNAVFGEGVATPEHALSLASLAMSCRISTAAKQEQ
jgi:hypothetical protein